MSELTEDISYANARIQHAIKEKQAEMSGKIKAWVNSGNDVNDLCINTDGIRSEIEKLKKISEALGG